MRRFYVYGNRRVEQGAKTEEEWMRDLRALQVLEEYTLVSAGFSYQDLGYRTADGGVPTWKLREFLFVHRVVQDAIHEK